MEGRKRRRRTERKRKRRGGSRGLLLKENVGVITNSFCVEIIKISLRDLSRFFFFF